MKLHKINDQLVLDIDTYELTDIVDDYLTEEGGIVYEFLQELPSEEYRTFRLFFNEKCSETQLIQLLENYTDNELIDIVKFQS